MLTPPEVSSPEFKRLSRLERTAWNMIPGKAAAPEDLLPALPAMLRERLAGSSPAKEALSLADGERDVLQLAKRIEERLGRKLGTKEIRDIIAILNTLSSDGAIAMRYRISLGKEDIRSALGQCGLGRGNIVFVHSSMTALGHVLGGAKTVIEALLETVGPEGLLAMPTFYDDGVIAVTECGMKKEYPPNSQHISSPYDPRTTKAYTGAIPNAFWPREAAVRSNHPTHSVAASGRRAEWFIQGHGPDKSAFDRQGPFGKIVDHGGYFLFLGTGLGPMTFLHVLEEWLDLPYMPTATVRIMEGGKERLATAPKYPDGHRSFYLPEPNKAMNAIAESGIEFREAPLGLAGIQMALGREIYEKLAPRIRKERDLLLCDNNDCSFCTWAKSQVRKQGG